MKVLVGIIVGFVVVMMIFGAVSSMNPQAFNKSRAQSKAAEAPETPAPAPQPQKTVYEKAFPGLESPRAAAVYVLNQTGRGDTFDRVRHLDTEGTWQLYRVDRNLTPSRFISFYVIFQILPNRDLRFHKEHAVLNGAMLNDPYDDVAETAFKTLNGWGK
jgi:hypothetical protein